MSDISIKNSPYGTNVKINTAGLNSLKFEAQNLKPGTYFYSLILDNELIDTKPMIIIQD